MSYDGTIFKGLDEDAFRDTFGDDQPLDVWLEQRIRSNSLYIATGYDSASKPYYSMASTTSADTDERRWASRNWARHDFMAIRMDPGFESATVSFNIAVAAEDSGGTGVNFRLKLVEWTGQAPSQHTELAVKEFSVAGTTFTGEAHTVALDGPYLGPPKIVFLEVWMRSDANADTGSNLNFSGPTAARIDRFVVNDDTDEFYDFREVEPNTVNLYPGNFDTSAVYSIWTMWYANIRGLSVRLNYAGDIRIEAPSTVELGAQRSIFSTTSIPQIEGAARTYSAPRHVAFGPSGVASPEEFSSSPWYLWQPAPVNEVMMDGLTTASTDRTDTWDVVICWLVRATNLDELQLDVDTTVTFKLLEAGDTSWSGATTIASGTREGDLVTFAKEGSNTMASLRARFHESTSHYMIHDSLTWENENDSIAVTVVRVDADDTFSAADFQKPLLCNIAFSYTFTGQSDIAAEYVVTPYVCSYSVIARPHL